MTLNVCPVDYVVDLISGKWKVLIIWNLSLKKKRFGELERSLNGVSKKMLSQHLRELEEDGLINRNVFATVPPQVEYSLTDRGEELSVILQDLNTFGTKLLNSTKLS
jgi:DNA-binding HxlR family transcriptional regulator